MTAPREGVRAKVSTGGKSKAKRYRKPPKPAVTVSMRAVETWLEAEGGPLRTARGRPRRGEIPLIPHIQAHFQVSRSTAHRLLRRIAARRKAALAALPVDPLQAAMLAAMAGRYASKNVSGGPDKNVSPVLRGTQFPVPHKVTPTGAEVKHSPLPPALSLESLAAIVLRALRDWPDQSLLRDARSVIESRMAIQAPPGGRGLDAIGLRMGPTHSVHMKGNPPAHRLVTDALVEALEAFGSTVRPVGMTADLVVRLREALSR